MQSGLKSQLEARLAAVSERVGALAQRESKQEKKRGGWLREAGRVGGFHVAGKVGG